MPVMLGTHAESGGVMFYIFSALELLDFRFLDKIAGDADDITVACIEAKIPKVLLERTLDDVENIFRISMNGHVNREDITGAGREVVVEMAKNLELVDEIFRFFANRDTRTRSYLDIRSDTYLRMQKKMPAGCFTIRVK